MIRNTIIQRILCQLLAVLLIGANLNGLAVAGLVSTDQIQQSQQTNIQRDAIKTMIARSEVQDMLAANGVTAAEVIERVDNMSDQEVASLHENLQELPAGQGALEVVLLVFIILILLDLTGVTDIFPRI